MDWATAPAPPPAEKSPNSPAAATGQAGRRRIENRGQPPLLVRSFAGTVRLLRPGAASLPVQPLDYRGYPSGPARPHGDAIRLDPETPYYLVGDAAPAAP